LVTRRFQEGTRQHSKKLWWRIHGQIERLAVDRLLALFTAILPAGAAVFHSEALFDRRLHVIVAAAFVFGRNSRTVDFPRGNDVIAAPAIVVEIFDAYAAAR